MYVLEIRVTKYFKLRQEVARGLEVGRIRAVAQDARSIAPVHAKRLKSMRYQRLVEDGGGVY